VRELDDPLQRERTTPVRELKIIMPLDEARFSLLATAAQTVRRNSSEIDARLSAAARAKPRHPDAACVVTAASG